MSDVKSKNPYELLGNDPEEDSDKEPQPPTRAIEKPVARQGKRNAPESAPRGGGAERGGRGGGRRGDLSGNDAAYHDSGAGARVNRSRPTEDGDADRPPRRGGARGQRGGRGASFRDNRDDRHSKGLPNEHNKQTDQSWGGNTGTSEWADERAGEAIAQSEAAENGVTVAPGEEATAADAPEPEPEDKGRSLDDFLAEQAQKRIALGGPLAARKANEGSKPDKKWAQAKAINRDEQDDSYIAPQGQKSARQRERKEKQVVEIDHRFVEQPRERGGYRGGRGEGRGGRGEGRGSGRGRGEGRGEGRGDSFRGGRGRGEFRGRGEGRGEYRGRGEGRGEYRGRGGRGGANVNVADTSAFPSLGS